MTDSSFAITERMDELLRATIGDDEYRVPDDYVPSGCLVLVTHSRMDGNAAGFQYKAFGIDAYKFEGILRSIMRDVEKEENEVDE